MLVLTIAIGARPREPQLRRRGTRRRPRADLERRHRRPDRRPRHLRPRRRRLRPARAATSASASRASSACASRRSRPTCPTSSTSPPRGSSSSTTRRGGDGPGARADRQRRASPSRSSASRARSGRTTRRRPQRRRAARRAADHPGPRRPRQRLHARHRRAAVRRRPHARTATPLTATTGDGKVSPRRHPRVRRPPDRRQELLRQLRRRQPVVFNGSIYFASGGAKFFPGKPFNATITDRHTADDKNPDGTPNTEAFRHRADLRRTARSTRSRSKIDTLTIQLGELRDAHRAATSCSTRAPPTTRSSSPSRSVGAKVKLGSLELSGEARNFAFLGDGTFKTKPGFGVFLGVGSRHRRQLQVAVLPADQHRRDRHRSGPTSQNHPEDFVLTLSASVTGIKGIDGLRVLGLDPGHPRSSRRCSRRASSRSSRIDSLGVSVKGNLFGGDDRRRPARRHPQARRELQHHRRLRHDDAGRAARLLPRPPGRLLDGRHGGLHHPPRPLRARPAVGVHQRRACPAASCSSRRSG